MYVIIKLSHYSIPSHQPMDNFMKASLSNLDEWCLVRGMADWEG